MEFPKDALALFANAMHRRTRSRKKATRKGRFPTWNELYSGLVDDLLDRVLGLADSLLSFALELLPGAFDLKVRVADGVADALLDCASSFVGRALDFIGCATHDRSPKELMATHFAALHAPTCNSTPRP